MFGALRKLLFSADPFELDAAVISKQTGTKDVETTVNTFM